MEKQDEFEEGQVFNASRTEDEFRVELDGFEGPADVLLSLAREQKVDITQISILSLADQYLAFISKMEKLNLELAADYLVMAAWLAFLKSRLLLPEVEDESEPTGPEMVAALQYQLKRLEAMQDLGKRLINSPQLGTNFYARGKPETFRVQINLLYELSINDLIKAYDTQRRRKLGLQAFKVEPFKTFSVEKAVQRLRQMMGTVPGWRELWAFLPAGLESGLLKRSAVASMFAASLELAKEGHTDLRQGRVFGPIHIRSKKK